MTAADQIRALLASILGPAWRIQFGRWVDDRGVSDASEGGAAKLWRFAVLKPVGGLPVELVRRPQFTLTFIGIEGGDLETQAAAEAVVEAMRNTNVGNLPPLVSLQPAEPVFMATGDGRPVFELAISAITD